MVSGIALSSLQGELLWACDCSSSGLADVRTVDLFHFFSHHLQTTNVVVSSFPAGECFYFLFHIDVSRPPATPDVDEAAAALQRGGAPVDAWVSNVGGVLAFVLSARQLIGGGGFSNTDEMLLDAIGECVRTVVSGSAGYTLGTGASGLAEPITAAAVQAQLRQLAPMLGKMVSSVTGDAAFVPAVELLEGK